MNNSESNTSGFIITSSNMSFNTDSSITRNSYSLELHTQSSPAAVNEVRPFANMKITTTEAVSGSGNSNVDSVGRGPVSNGVNLGGLINNALGVNANNTIVGVAAVKHEERYVWEMRTRSPNTTPVSTILNSPDLNNDIQYSLRPHQSQLQQVPVGRSPGTQFDQQNILPQGLTSPSSPTDVGKAGGQCLRNGEIVVFDDIDTNWMNKNNMSYGSKAVSTKMRNVFHSNEDVLKVTKMIGQLPIAEYEGSPRRFGNQLSNEPTFSKRPPGFPQRVSPLSTLTLQQQLQHQQQQEAAHARHQKMQQQYQFYAQATCSGSTVLTNSPIPILSCSNDNSSAVGNLIDIDTDDNLLVGKIMSRKSADTGSSRTKTPTFDYLYEFSETRKVLEEFFKVNPNDEKQFSDFSGDDLINCDNRHDFEDEMQNANDCDKDIGKAYIGQRLARIKKDELYMVHCSTKKQQQQQLQQQQQVGDNNINHENNDIELYTDVNSRSSGDLGDTELDMNLRQHSRNFTLSPETTDYDSNCGDLDSLSNDMNCTTDFGKLYTSMPVLEDGLSSGHASDSENNCQNYTTNYKDDEDALSTAVVNTTDMERSYQPKDVFEQNKYNNSLRQDCILDDCVANDILTNLIDGGINAVIREDELKLLQQKQKQCIDLSPANKADFCDTNSFINKHNYNCDNMNCEPTYATIVKQSPPPPPAPQPHRQIRGKVVGKAESLEIQEAMKEIRSALQRAKTQPEKLKICDEVLPPGPGSPIWVPRKMQIDSDNIVMNVNSSNVEHTVRVRTKVNDCDEEQDTDLETDRLLGQKKTDDHEFFEEKNIWTKPSCLNSTLNSNEQSPSTSDVTMLTSDSTNLKPQSFSSATIRRGIGTALTDNSQEHCQVTITSPEKLQYDKSLSGSIKSLKDVNNHNDKKAKTRNKEGFLEPLVLIEGVLFRARYLGSTQLVCEGQPTKSTRMMQAEEAVSRIKAPEGENQPSTEVDLFISTEKIMVLNTDLKEIMMDHALRTISYIADIGDLVVLMARRRFIHSDPCNSGTVATTCTDIEIPANRSTNNDTGCTTFAIKDKDSKEKDTSSSTTKHNRTPKMICHVFESDEAQFIAQSIGQAFQVAYMEFLKANGIENENLAKEMDYQEVLNSQEIFGDELEIFAKKELQKEVVVPKAKGEILGVVIVESGWGSMLPTVVIANLMSGGAAARCGQLNIGDQLIAINGLSLVGLPLSTCQNYIRNAKNQTAVKFTVVPCPPVVEVKILRPKALFQLGFSVQNGVICSLLRGGIAERGGVRVGHRIIEINNQSVVAVPHETIVKLLSSSVGEILMKTMPTSMFRLLTGQETPIYI